MELIQLLWVNFTLEHHPSYSLSQEMFIHWKNNDLFLLFSSIRKYSYNLYVDYFQDLNTKANHKLLFLLCQVEVRNYGSKKQDHGHWVHSSRVSEWERSRNSSLFCTFLLMYMTSLIGNTMIILLVCVDYTVCTHPCISL